MKGKGRQVGGGWWFRDVTNGCEIVIPSSMVRGGKGSAVNEGGRLGRAEEEDRPSVSTHGARAARSKTTAATISTLQSQSCEPPPGVESQIESFVLTSQRAIVKSHAV